MRRSTTPVQQAEKLASQQHAAINRRQAAHCGLSSRQIDRLVEKGRWRLAARSVFVMGGSVSNWKQDAAVAWLASPPGSVLSHRTAAALHGLGRPPKVPEVTVPPGCSGRIRQAKVHTARTPAGVRDCRWRDGLYCTDVSRSIADLAPVLTHDELCDLVDTALCERKTRPGAIAAAAARAGRAKGRSGVRALADGLSIWRPGPVADSVMEMRLARRLEQWGLPPLERQVKIRDASGKVIARADLGIPSLKIYFEYDGKKGHTIRYWGCDDDRDRAIEALGGTIVRFNRHDLLPSSTRLRDVLEAIVAAQPALVS